MPHEAPALPAKQPLPEPQSSWGSPLSPASALQLSCEGSRVLAGVRVPSILLTNPQSLTNCFEEFKEVVACHNPDIVVVSETWFSETRPAMQHNLVGYKLFHDDREGRGGGVAVYARESLNPQEVHLKAPPELECVWVAVDGGMIVCGLYHAPRAPTGPALMDKIVNSMVDIRSHNPSMMFTVAGDFNNLPHNRLCACLNLTNLVQEPTHHNSTIDLVLTDAAEAFGRPRLLAPIGRSQHSCVLVTPKTHQGAGVMDLNLPNVPGQPVHTQPRMAAGGFNIPPCGPPPPADASADALPEKISNNMQDFSGTGQWTDPMGMKNSPPPYSSIPPMGHTSNTTPTPNAPYPSMPYAGQQGPRPQFPPDVATGGENLKDGEQPKPAPRSKFGEGGSDFTMPDLPSVPDLPGTATLPDPQENKDDIDFDDLTKRFEDLKKKK